MEKLPFSGRLQPDWGYTTRAAMAGLGSIGLIDLHKSLTEQLSIPFIYASNDVSTTSILLYTVKSKHCKCTITSTGKKVSSRSYCSNTVPWVL